MEPDALVFTRTSSISFHIEQCRWKTKEDRTQPTVCSKQLQEIKILLHLVLNWDPVAHNLEQWQATLLEIHPVLLDGGITNVRITTPFNKSCSASLILKPVFLFPQEPACQWSSAGCFPLTTPMLWFSTAYLTSITQLLYFTSKCNEKWKEGNWMCSLLESF